MALESPTHRKQLAAGIILCLLSFGISYGTAAGIGVPALIMGVSAWLQSLVFAAAITVTYGLVVAAVNIRQSSKVQASSDQPDSAQDLSQLPADIKRLRAERIKSKQAKQPPTRAELAARARAAAAEQALLNKSPRKHINCYAPLLDNGVQYLSRYALFG